MNINKPRIISEEILVNKYTVSLPNFEVPRQGDGLTEKVCEVSDLILVSNDKNSYVASDTLESVDDNLLAEPSDALVNNLGQIMNIVPSSPFIHGSDEGLYGKMVI